LTDKGKEGRKDGARKAAMEAYLLGGGATIEFNVLSVHPSSMSRHVTSRVCVCALMLLCYVKCVERKRKEKKNNKDKRGDREEVQGKTTKEVEQ